MNEVESKQNTDQKKVLTGVVLSNKMDKTAVVSVQRYVKHSRYGKFVRQHKKYKVHDPEEICSKGDKVQIKETRKRSKNKAFEVSSKLA